LSLWRCHWKDSKRFYKPELDAAHNPRLQAIRPSFADGVWIPLPGATNNWDRLT
jgi:hypothetical protein